MALRTIVRNRLLDDMLHTVAEADDGWKALIVDEETLAIISAACRVHDIMEEKITIVENLNLKRQPLPSLSAIYFLSATERSVGKFLADWSDKNKLLYKHAHVFFSTRLPDRYFNLIAKSPAAAYIKTLKDLNMDFLAVEPQVFTLNKKDDLYKLYSPSAPGLNEELSNIADKLVTVCATLGEYPSIRYHRSEHSQIAADLATLVQKKMDRFAAENSNFEPKSDQGTLLIVGRDVDTLAPILHEFTYQAMVYDLLDIEEGGIYTHETVDGRGEPKQKKVMLDENDELWVQHRHSHISDTSQAIAKDFKEFVNTNKGAKLSKGGKDKDIQIKDLAEAVKDMPQYQAMIAKYSLHISMTQKCMDIFRKHNLVRLAGQEQNMATGEDGEGNPVKNAITQLTTIVRDPQVTVEEKMRLVMAYIMTEGGMKEEQRVQLMEMGGFSIEQQNTIRNLIYLGVQVSKANKEKRKALKRKSRAGKKDSVPFELSRFVPAIKDIAEEHLTDKLSTSEFPYVKDPPPAGSRTSRSSVSSASSTTSSHSLRKPKTSAAGSTRASWASKRGDKGDKDSKSKAPEIQTKGPRLIIFMLGGATYSETRSAYELTKELKREVIIGATSLLTPATFLKKLSTLKADKNNNDDDDDDF
eukprot:GEZU01011698.1.p1 GENE.GEZU01011698.1~~GEZU01011698.1.p1  ORF type:complete len:640 (-),score=194.46 GEZU01011698.1:182-2101(-)